jgi:hypothetical protein
VRLSSTHACTFLPHASSLTAHLRTQLESNGNTASAPHHQSQSQSPPRSTHFDSPGGIVLPRAALDMSFQFTDDEYQGTETVSFAPFARKLDFEQPQYGTQLLYSGWNTDLPEPHILHHLCVQPTPSCPSRVGPGTSSANLSLFFSVSKGRCLLPVRPMWLAYASQAVVRGITTVTPEASGLPTCCDPARHCEHMSPERSFFPDL